jgi:hypothetical protein
LAAVAVAAAGRRWPPSPEERIGPQQYREELRGQIWHWVEAEHVESAVVNIQLIFHVFCPLHFFLLISLYLAV